MPSIPGGEQVQTAMKIRFLFDETRTLLALISLLALVSCTDDPPTLLIGSGGTLGNYASVSRAISRVVNEHQSDGAFRLRPEQTVGAVENIDAVLAGEVTFGITQADREYQATQGLGAWKGKGPQGDLRSMFSLYSESITLVASRESGIETLGDVLGKRVDLGHVDSGSRQNAIDVLEAAGIDWQKDLLSTGDPPDERSQKYLHSELDAFFTTVGHPSMDIKFAVNSLPRARIVPLADLNDLLERSPYYSKSRIPVSLYPGIENDTDIETIGVKAVLLTSSSVSEEVVYEVTRAVFEGIDSLRRFDPVLDAISTKGMLEGITAPLHPGARRYYEEIGLLTSESPR